MGHAPFEELKVWQKAHALVLKIYRLAKEFPPDERFRLTNQLCRAAVSVPTNIAESTGRYYRREQIQFLFIARGSAEETRYLIRLARDLGYISADDYAGLRAEYDEVPMMLNGLIKAREKGIAGKIAYVLAILLPMPAACASAIYSMVF